MTRLKTVTEGEHYINQTDMYTAPLKSVIEVNSLDEFLHAATMADRKFEGERNAVVIIGGDNRFGESVDTSVPIPEDIQDIPIPRRPEWTEDDTAESLDAKEKASFLEWRRGLAG
jgi:large subunit GTPase 1